MSTSTEREQAQRTRYGARGKVAATHEENVAGLRNYLADRRARGIPAAGHRRWLAAAEVLPATGREGMPL